ncbi:uncharacterized protein SPPG_04522 [Spizellomyces punctatus DAOM BR117]|uniref:Glucose-methanol-choline oxidoreductase N-terminal domain-containing protein n=1 Tax=Spizellomyces punctatus (strain DAOM BR117) TaxID=645134 RepID=A0A0L0HFD5_SPIPD|nr:uncharacterized protein SPPG_04522 [Spizellomyces punctatus DAOM BR117]KND00181.1 hypothetical protein SPPG_04522 [Spizellomyces punctatus DAOM BR117]|eukprot:XP_016608220.1 hypothetical protein SPPG_04522 [Spizellomyces punctatus DAOM BR117]
MKTLTFGAVAALALGLATTSTAAVSKPNLAARASTPACSSYSPAGYPALKCSGDGVAKDANFDYIVVGSGAGGGPLAVRLARAGFAVLLIEAGSDYESNNTTIPAFHARSNEDPNIAWDYSISQGLPKRDKVWYPRVSSLGGCTVHNAMIHMYPHPSDWNSIAKTFNDSSFRDENMRPLFQRLETSNSFCSDDGSADNGHGYNGWLQTQLPDMSLLYNPPDPQLVSLFTDLVSTVPGTPGGDVNAPGGTSAEGWHLVPTAVTPRRERSSVYQLIQDELEREASLDPICKLSGDDQKTNKQPFIRPLTIWTNTLVTSLDIDGTNVRGVKYTQGRALYRASPLASNIKPLPLSTVRAKREVILSAGTFNTPQILQLSGIGDMNDLQKYKSKEGGPGAEKFQPRLHLPGVGKNLQDRYEISVNVAMKQDWELLKNCKFTADPNDPCFTAYKRGLTSTCAAKKWESSIYGTNGVFLGITQRSVPTVPDPDLYIFGGPLNFHGYIKGYPQEIADSKNVFSFLILKAHTNNTLGTVTITSTDYRDTPAIDFKYYADGDTDLLTVAGAVKQVRNLITHGQYVDHEIFPGANVKTDADIVNYIKQNSWGHHACGTAKMGKASDPTAVVDNNFKVHGVNGLRIVDASVWPKIPGFFIATPTYMMSEKAADIIKQSAATGVCPRAAKNDPPSTGGWVSSADTWSGWGSWGN